MVSLASRPRAWGSSECGVGGRWGVSQEHRELRGHCHLPLGWGSWPSYLKPLPTPMTAHGALGHLTLNTSFGQEFNCDQEPRGCLVTSK